MGVLSRYQPQERCDSKADCSDLTDEKDCRLYELDVDYLKDKLPPTLLGFSKVQVRVSVCCEIPDTA